MHVMIVNTVNCWSRIKELNSYNNKYFSTFQSEGLSGKIKLFLMVLFIFDNKYKCFADIFNMTINLHYIYFKHLEFYNDTG